MRGLVELTGLGFVLQFVGWIYWIVAIALVVAAFRYARPRHHRWILAGIVLAMVSVLPVIQWLEVRERRAYAKAAVEYFKKMCAERAGQRIFSTHTGVESVLVTDLLPPANDQALREQYWMGDPYSEATPSPDRGIVVGVFLIGPRKYLPPPRNAEPGLKFVEIEVGSAQSRAYERITVPDLKRHYVREPIEKPVSKFTVTWKDISTMEDRKFWVAGSRLEVRDRETGKLVAERIGYIFEAGLGSRRGSRMSWGLARRPGTTCPEVVNEELDDRLFLLEALRP